MTTWNDIIEVTEEIRCPERSPYSGRRCDRVVGHPVSRSAESGHLSDIPGRMKIRWYESSFVEHREEVPK